MHVSKNKIVHKSSKIEPQQQEKAKRKNRIRNLVDCFNYC